MAQTIAIPGRRIQDGETFRTDWVPRGGDCVILRVEVLVAAGGGGDTVDFALETRGENGTTVTTITPTSTAISASTTGVKTCLYLATTSTRRCPTFRRNSKAPGQRVTLRDGLLVHHGPPQSRQQERHLEV